MAHTLKRIKGQATHACFIGIPRQVAGGAAFKTLPPYGRQLFEIRRRGQVPANYTVVALDDWKLGKLFTLVVKQEASDEQAQPLASLSDRPTTMPTAATTITSVEREPRGQWKDTPEVELRLLVNRVADYHGFTTEQRQGTLQIALADLQSVLECFRTLASQILQ